jgi:hypothetical protein
VRRERKRETSRKEASGKVCKLKDPSTTPSPPLKIEVPQWERRIEENGKRVTTIKEPREQEVSTNYSVCLVSILSRPQLSFLPLSSLAPMVSFQKL